MRIVIFGIGYCFEMIYKFIDKQDEIVAYIDNNPQKNGCVINGKKVSFVSIIKELQYDRVVICSENYPEMKSQLLDLQVDDLKICSFQEYIKNKGRKHQSIVCKKLDEKLDIDFLKKSHFELSRYSDADLINYFGQFGEKNGIIGSNSGYREGLVDIINSFPKSDVSILEIGPFDNPKCVGDNTKYFDIYDSERLKKEAKERGREYNNVPQKIDYVSSQGDLLIVNEAFDLVFSCHSIEHQPNLINHLRNVEKLLKPKGCYAMIVPDMRYTFDYYSPISTLGQVIEDYENDKMFNSLSDVLNMSFLRTHNNPLRHWRGDHGKPFGLRDSHLEKEAYVNIGGKIFCDSGNMDYTEIKELIQHYKKSRENGVYIDAHSYRFTPKSFEYIIFVLKKLGYIDLDILCVHNTPYGRQEFCSVLQKG